MVDVGAFGERKLAIKVAVFALGPVNDARDHVAGNVVTAFSLHHQPIANHLDPDVHPLDSR